MNGPAFSTRAEAAMHRMLGADLIGMTNAPEARLCREAEIAMATLALVTDYDCWKTDAAAVDLQTVLDNLHANSTMAKQIVRDVIASPAEDWDKQRRVEYVQWAVNVVEGLRGASDQLDELFDEVVALANEKLDEVD